MQAGRHPAGMGFNYFAVAALVLSCCDFFFVFGCRIFFFCYVPAVFVYGCPAISFDSDVFVRGGDIKGLLLCHLTCIPSLPIFDSAVMHINQMNHLNHFKCTTLLC